MLKVGDKVRVKSIKYLLEHRSEAPTIVEKMLQYADGVYEIKDIFGPQQEVTLDGVFDDTDGVSWIWAQHWLEPCVELNVDADMFMNILNGEEK